MSNSRFDKLERSRSKDDAKQGDKPTHGASLGRFDVDTSKAREGDATPAAMERFEADGTQGLRVERRDDAEQPFVRCPVCEHDWGRLDTRCGNCGEALNSDKARTFNAALWAKRQEEKKELDAGSAERAQSQAAAVLEAAAEKRRYASLLAAEVKHQYDQNLPDESSARARWRAQSWALIPTCVVLAVAMHGPARWVFLLAALGIACARLPKRYWSAVFKKRE